MQISLSDAIKELRDELRVAVLEGEDQDIVFTPNEIDVELGVTFTSEAKAGGGIKVFAVLDLSAEGKLNKETQHKVRLSLSVANRDGETLKIRSDVTPRGLPR